MFKTLFITLFFIFSAIFIPSVQANEANNSLVVGAQQYAKYLPQLKNKRVGLVVNQTSTVGQTHLVDALLTKNINITKIFAPEHGFRGDHDAGAHVKNAVDSKTGIPLISIYGKNKKPSQAALADVDVIIFDIQDVGVRFYTYISSMHYMMEAAAEQGIEFLVLDRPNPNIAYVDGPILEPEFKSFVGMHPIPVLHGMTVGELAKMIKGEGWINKAPDLKLTVIPVDHYTRKSAYSLPVKPSPNLPNDQAIALYPSLCFFEATPISIGRGTDFAFQVIGYSPITLGDFSFTPRAIKGAALNPKFKNQTVQGLDLRQANITGLNLTYLINAYTELSKNNISFFERADFMDKLAGTNKLRLAIEAGQSEAQIKQSWQAGLAQFKAQRAPYLLYK
ncbi:MULTISPECIES: exo-beta-N-acetylmuramidase NamZ domain-containing protein [unclassified Pseudoalteromonas]|uniref:exo-beta-N-acetylmuramidase NamZ family protein n=1 Tax=unclassified Pseudoalteromonas TaxID=194690 RepID=UPI00386E7D30